LKFKIWIHSQKVSFNSNLKLYEEFAVIDTINKELTIELKMNKKY